MLKLRHRQILLNTLEHEPKQIYIPDFWQKAFSQDLSCPEYHKMIIYTHKINIFYLQIIPCAKSSETLLMY
jgi:hypothetical protein